MELNRIQDVDVAGKNVFVRVDFNVSRDDDGNVKDEYKIASARETIEYLCKGGARVAMTSHVSKTPGIWTMDDAEHMLDDDMQKFSLQDIVDDASRIIGKKIIFVPDVISDDIARELENCSEDTVLLLENPEFYTEEKEPSEVFAKKCAEPFDVFVHEAFASSHRGHVTRAAIAAELPAYAGLYLQKEVFNLTAVKDAPEHPAVAIIGGAKIEDKVPIIGVFEKAYDSILVGGRTSVEAIDQGEEFSDIVTLPTDFTHADRYDIGPETIEKFVGIISTAKTIVWNGPMGKFEESPYDAGTVAVAEAIANNTEAFSVVGGGESVQALSTTGHFDDISFVSTGGGAMLKFIAGEQMPGLEILTNDRSCS